MGASLCWMLAACSSTGLERAVPTAPVAPDPVAGSGATDSPLADEAPVPRLDWSRVDLSSDAKIAAAWRQLIPTAAGWDFAVLDIPRDARGRSMLMGLLREGNFRCARIHHAHACRSGDPELIDLPSTATMDDPCLRREVAAWAVESLSLAELMELSTSLTELVSIPPPELVLADVVLEAVAEAPDDFRMKLIAAAKSAGQSAAVDVNLGGLPEEALTRAARDLHIDGAVEALDVSTARSTYLAAVRDQKLRPQTRLHALRELTADLDLHDSRAPADLIAAWTGATKDPDCRVAMAAAHALDDAGKSGYLPVKFARKPDELMRAVCLLAADSIIESPLSLEGTRMLPRFVAASGLRVVEREFDPTLPLEGDDNADGDGDPRTTRAVHTLPAYGAELPFADELDVAMRHCKGNRCEIPGAGVRFMFSFVREKGRTVLTQIERSVEPSPCDVALENQGSANED